MPRLYSCHFAGGLHATPDAQTSSAGRLSSCVVTATSSRPHRALKFGRETKTPAMQALLVSKPLTLSDNFTAGVSLHVL